MRLRNARLRTKIIALLLSLTALWAFAAWVTLREGVNLLWVSTLNNGVAQPIDDVQPELQQERRLTLVWMGSPSESSRAALDAQRAKTDKTIAAFVKKAKGESVKLAQSGALKTAIAQAESRFDGLGALRVQVDTGALDRGSALTSYSQSIDPIFRIDDSLATLDDKDFARDTRALIQLNRARELFSQEDALLAGSLAAHRFAGTELLQFTQLVGAQRYSMAEALEVLQGSDMKSYTLLADSKGMADVRVLEDRVLAKNRNLAVPAISAAEWSDASTPALADLKQAVFGGGDRLVTRATPIALGVVLRLLLAGGLGLLAVVASIVLSITTARQLVRQLERLRDAAHKLADERLPGVVERLGHGEDVDVATEAPPLSFGDDQIGQVGQAFNKVQETAIRTAVEQAELRRSIRDILLSLARRSQALVHRQLTLLDVMERREMDTTELEDLFRVDHLATRMRRNAENLIILSGATPARGWRRPVPMMDVVRSAVAEVEDYTRVNVLPMGEVALAGRAVGDIAHLLAELIENAVSFSPPYTVAQVSGHMAANGYAVEIEDRGLGMTDEALDSINERIVDPPEFNLSQSVQLGLYVVGRLAERYGVKVMLKHSPYGGTTAVVLIPRELVVENSADAPDEVPATVAALPIRVTEPAPAAPPVRALPPSPPPPPDPQEESGMPTTTPSGLPMRVPQASLAEPLKTADGAADDQPQAEEVDPGRSPEEIRRIVGAFQTGTRRGRAAAQSRDTEPEDAETPPAEPRQIESEGRE